MKAFKTVGVDGCADGWVVCALNGSKVEHPYVVSTFEEVLGREHDAAVIAVDIPIGLTRKGSARKCDSEARKLLRHRACCVFNAPDRDVVAADSYAQAQQLSRRHCDKGISKQSFAIFAKVREVDELLRRSRPSNVIEVHPELCFYGIAGSPLCESKRRAEGFEKRKVLLERHIGAQILLRTEVRKSINAKPDDYLDALVSAYTAKRHVEGQSRCVPAGDEFDEFGLQMQMWF